MAHVKSFIFFKGEREMSIHISSVVWRESFDTPLQKLILLAFADMANDEGYCWPSVRSIKERVGVADSTVRENVRLLEGLGWLKREVRSFATDGRQTSNGYWVAKTPPSAKALRGAQPPPPLAPSRYPPSAQPLPLNHQATKNDTSNTGQESAPEQEDSFTPVAIKNLWNSSCPSLPALSDVTASRFRAARARSGGKLKSLQAAFDKMEASDFVAGRSDRGPSRWASFDWLMKPDNWTKVIEGRYDNEVDKNKNTSTVTKHAF